MICGSLITFADEIDKDFDVRTNPKTRGLDLQYVSRLTTKKTRNQEEKRIVAKVK